MSDSAALVEHFFRHEYGRLVGLLTRSLGVRHLELVEDAVQMALWRALQTWSRRGVPEAPAAWLHRTARNLAIDALRRESNLERKRQSIAVGLLDSEPPTSADDALHDELQDESLRLLFLCCQPSISPESQIALALKIVGGFSVEEIACGLLASPANIEKRLTRAKASLRQVGEELATLSIASMEQRLSAVLQVLYLMFNEGFAASHGDAAMKRDVCDEAIRLLRMLLAHPVLGKDPAGAALLALMLMHSARFDTRLDADRCIVLLADQDRTAWNWSQVREAMQWMLAAAHGDLLSRYHVEAAIAWEHSRANSLESTDWCRVTELYDLLLKIAPSAMVRLNAIIALSYRDGVAPAIAQLLTMPESDRKQLRPWWDCAMAQLHERAGDWQRARAHWGDALALAGVSASRQLIERRLARLSSLHSLSES